MYLGKPFKAPCASSFLVTLSDKDSKTIGDSMEETKEYHTRYLRAINSPVRREILRALKDGEATVRVLGERTSIDEKALNWHLSILEHGFCVEKKDRDGKIVFDLTQEGRVVDFVDQ
jgi:DNA-binding transcriptional ArsR family regulator